MSRTRRPLGIVGASLALCVGLLAFVWLGPPAPGDGVLVEQAVAQSSKSCPRVVMIGVRGSGQTSKDQGGYGEPVGNFNWNFLPELRNSHRVVREPLNYPAVGSTYEKGMAFFRLSGLGLGAYHDSVVDGKRILAGRITAWQGVCDPAFTKIVLVGFSQGAHVVGDVYRQMAQSSPGRTGDWIRGVVLFGDPKFNPDQDGNRNGASEAGSLGKRAAFDIPKRTLYRSYCNSGDAVCQSRITRNFDPHLAYDDRGEAADAARWLSTDLRAWMRANPWPPKPGTIVRNPITGASWLVNSRGSRNWIPTGGDWLCLRNRGARVVNVRGSVINTLRDEIGIHATCPQAPATGGGTAPAPVTVPAPAAPLPAPSAPRPTAANLVAVNYGGGHVGVAFDVGWQAGRDPVTCRFYRNGVEVFAAQCGIRASKQFYDLGPGSHTFHATVTDRFGVTSAPTNSVTVVVAGSPPAPVSDRLSNDGRLLAAQNQFLRSADGRYRLVMQQDSNLVLYGPSGRAIWASNTVGRGAHHLRMQGDGNLVIYNGANAPIWSTNTPRHYSAFLVVQNDGNVVIYDAGRPIWATNTVGRT